jgi:transposase
VSQFEFRLSADSVENSLENDNILAMLMLYPVREGEARMMGRQNDAQEKLFYSFQLEDHIPNNHLLRGINRFLDLSDLHQHMAEFYSHIGRPSVDPELMIRMLIIGYCFGIRSERRLCEDVHLNLAYRWFCRLGLEDAVPDHSSFSKNRHGRFRESGVFRHLFENVVRRCMSEGLVGGEGFAVDASVVKADASRARRIPGGEMIDWLEADGSTRAVKEYLDALEENGAPATTPKLLSLTDPAARWTAAPGRPRVLWLLDQLSDRLGRRSDHRCRVDACFQNRGSERRSYDDRACRGTFRDEAAAPGWRCGLRCRCNVELVSP